MVLFRARFRLHWLASALVALPCALAAQEVAPGDTIHLRLLDRLGSGHRAPTVVRAAVIAPVASDGHVAIPPGSIVTGHVTGAGVERDGGKRHWIALELDDIAIPMGDAANDTLRTKLSMRVAAVDDSRESIDSRGRIVGSSIPSVVRSKRDWAILVLGVFHPVSALVLAATLEGERAERHRAVALDAGTELTVVTASDAMLGRWPEWSEPPQIAANGNADSIVASAPLETSPRAGGAPGDVIALALVGSPDQVSAAFAAAGWTRAVPMTVRGDFVTFLESAKGKGYLAQPMSELDVNGRKPDREYEKVADTFAKRHHLRMWRWPGGIARNDGTQLWLVAATHDTGVMFLTKRHKFTHRVDPRIDEERDKIVNDLVAAHAVAAMSYVRRAAPAGGVTVNGGRSPAVTDWRMAVLVLGAP